MKVELPPDPVDAALDREIERLEKLVRDREEQAKIVAVTREVSCKKYIVGMMEIFEAAQF